MSDFCHLHVHSEYSLLDGLGRTADLAKEAARLGQPALALTDHGVMHGVIEFFRNCKKNGVKPIIGVEAYMTMHGRGMVDRDPNKDKARHHLLLLAQNMTGYKNLLKLCSEAQLEGYYYKPRVDADLLARHADGLICTTGCMAAEIPWLLNPEDGRPPQPDKAFERLQWYIDVFGRDRFFVELQEHSIPALTSINKTLFDWAKKYDLQMIVTNDVHYVTAQDAKSHDTLLCVQTNSLVNQKERMRMSDSEYYLKSVDEMKATFQPLADLPDSAFTNTLKIAEMCEVDLEDESFHLPDLPPQPVEIMPAHFQEERDYPGFLRYLTDQGLIERYGDNANSAEVQARKEHELKIINDMGFAIYFLLVWDLCRYAQDRNIWWNVRGSGAGSIVAYALGVTLIDPLRHNLIFERFLNPGRISM
ncbi:MAG: PHP domain-containing protein, partial [Anaerolineae bacterium]|nr:PHP domain-containing protein [Anaerolineae bacterium]